MDSALYPVRRWRYLGLFLLCASFAYGCYAIAPEFRRPGKLYIVAAMLAICSPFALWELFRATDLAFDARGIRYKGKSIGWRDVRSINVLWASTTSRAGFIPDYQSQHHRVGDVDIRDTHVSVGNGSLIGFTNTTQTDEIHIEWAEGTLKIRGGSLVLPAGGVVAVAQRMIDLQKRVLGEQGAARARLGMAQDEGPAPEVPPPPAPPSGPPRPTFGRKGAAGTA